MHRPCLSCPVSLALFILLPQWGWDGQTLPPHSMFCISLSFSWLLFLCLCAGSFLFEKGKKKKLCETRLRFPFHPWVPFCKCCTSPVSSMLDRGGLDRTDRDWRNTPRLLLPFVARFTAISHLRSLPRTPRCTRFAPHYRFHILAAAATARAIRARTAARVRARIPASRVRARNIISL